MPSYLRAVRRLLPASWRRRVRRTMFAWLELTWTTPNGVSLRVASYNEWIIYNEIFVDGEYDAAIDAAIAGRAPDRPLQVLDLGANVGFFALRLFDRLRAAGQPDAACTATLVEANPMVLPALDARLRRDNALAPHVTVVPGLVGERSGSAAFDPSPASPGDGSIAPGGSAAAVTIPYIDLDRLMAGAPAIDLLKCDIEGAEGRLLEQYPALLRKTRLLVVEIHTERCPVTRCRALLHEAGLTHESVLRDRGGCALHVYSRA